jgi:hypothetical protein
MKLKELADVKDGISIEPRDLLSIKKSEGNYSQYLMAKDFIKGQSHYVSQKTLKNFPNFTQKSYLVYGDYIIYKNENEYKLFRYEDTSGQTIGGDGLIILRQYVGILKDYLGFDKNKKHFLKELKRIESIEGKITVRNIGELEIGAWDVRELEDANIADQIGIRKPVDIVAHPINVVQKPLPADKLIKRIDNNELLLDTDFQRRPDLWDFPTKSRLIESMLIGLPMPAFYFDGSNDDEWIVIDGLQRLSAMHGFVKEKFKLSELDYLTELNGKSFSELDRKHSRKIEEYEIVAYTIGKGTMPSVKFKIFKTINTSALKLVSQEIRHAINPGTPASLLKKIAGLDWFNKQLILSDSHKDRMYDREIALRFIAFQRTNYSEYTPGIVDFLDFAMTDMYEIPLHNQALLIGELENIFKIVGETLGERAFSRSLVDDEGSYPLNNIMFELITYGISIIPKSKRHKLKESKTGFKEIITQHFANKKDSFWDSERAYSKENLRKRFEEIEILFKRLTL